MVGKFPVRRIDMPERPKRNSSRRRARTLEDQLAATRTELEEKGELAEGYLDRLMRMQAEFENYRKRTEREREEMRKTASERIVAELVDVTENLERALEAFSRRNEASSNSLEEGIRMTLLQLKEVLGREGLSEIESVGKPFDPNYHEVVSTVTSEEHPENTVVREYMKGYLLNSRVLRTAKVEVSSGKAG
ncbi:MAG: nucleotide exchange factor GrpE [Theionarchaea archaeon]|nr:nucleotide exchange factor GrpE [Theionarchaea archaeon]